MAGLFGGLFNYDKEGPGLDKNAPKKNGIIVFFEIYFKNFWKLAINSVWYWLLTALGITAGFAAAGMTNLTRNMAADTHSFGTSDFFSTIKKNWKQALPAGIINIIVIGVLLFALQFYMFSTVDSTMQIIGMAICLFMLGVFLVMRYYIWFILITFKLKLKDIYLNSFKLSLVGFKKNIIIILSLVALYAVVFGIDFIGIALTRTICVALLIFVVPGFRFLVIQSCVFSNIKKYMIEPYYKEHPDEDIEMRRRLGVYEDDKPTYTEADLL